MTAEREIAGFVLPFAAGTFLATGILPTSVSSLSAACTAAFTTMSLILPVLLHPARKRFGDLFSWSMIILLGLAAGASAGFNSMALSISSSESAFSTWASGYGHSLGAAIDCMKFDNPQTNAILKALITGERADIPKSVTEAFRESGASHILALSGFHLGIIYGIIKCSLSIIGNDRKAQEARSAATISLCGFYTLATGAGPSIVRAFLFILLGEAGRMLHRKQTTASLLISAMLIQLAFSPGSIRSVSFQLSYAAMAGIAYIYPWLRKLWPGNPENDRWHTKSVRRVWDSAAMSISCQLATGPLAYLYFESFPVHFLLTNLIALPLTGLIIPAGITALALDSLGICPDIMLKATDMLVQALSAALEIISKM